MIIAFSAAMRALSRSSPRSTAAAYAAWPTRWSKCAVNCRSASRMFASSR